MKGKYHMNFKCFFNHPIIFGFLLFVLLSLWHCFDSEEISIEAIIYALTGFIILYYTYYTKKQAKSNKDLAKLNVIPSANMLCVNTFSRPAFTMKYIIKNLSKFPIQFTYEINVIIFREDTKSKFEKKLHGGNILLDPDEQFVNIIDSTYCFDLSIKDNLFQNLDEVYKYINNFESNNFNYSNFFQIKRNYQYSDLKGLQKITHPNRIEFLDFKNGIVSQSWIDQESLINFRKDDNLKKE
ncbi:MAG: hypothetical protein V1779_17475 [bacterium]